MNYSLKFRLYKWGVAIPFVLGISVTQGLEISGRVIDEAGNAVEHARLEWGLVTDLPGDRIVTHSDTAGYYKLSVSGVGSGYRLGVSAEGYGPAWQDYGPPWIHIDSDFEAPREVKGPLEVNFTLGSAHTLEGLVLDESGDPIPDVAIKARTPVEGFYSSFSSPSWATLFPGNDLFETSTDADGRLSLPGLPAGNINLALSAPHRHINDGSYPVDDFRVLTMSGSGRPGRIQGDMIDLETGKPVTEFVIARRYIAEQQHISNARGRFQWLENVTEDKDYAIHVYARGYAPFKETMYALPIESEEYRAFPLIPADPLLVRLTDALSGKAVENAHVIHGVLGDSRYFMWGDWDRYIDGRHGLSMVQRGAPDKLCVLWFCEDTEQRGTLFIRAPGYARTVIKPEARPGPDKSGVVEIRLQPEARIQGVLTSAGSPRTGVRIGLYRNKRNDLPELEFETIDTDDEGAFTFSGLEAGIYRVLEYRPLDQWTSRSEALLEFTVESGEHRDLGSLESVQPTPSRDRQ